MDWQFSCLMLFYLDHIVQQESAESIKILTFGYLAVLALQDIRSDAFSAFLARRNSFIGVY